MAKKRKVSKTRKFRGDTFTLKTKMAGMSKADAKKVAKTWREKGYAAVVDHGVGGSKKFGVYVRKRKKRGS